MLLWAVPGVLRDCGLWGAVWASWDPHGQNPSGLVTFGSVKLALLGKLVRVLLHAKVSALDAGLAR